MANDQHSRGQFYRRVRLARAAVPAVSFTIRTPACGVGGQRMEKSLGLVWPNKRHELVQWGFYNVVLGLLPVWASWLVLAVGGTTSLRKPLMDGTVLVFAATLSGSSLSFFSMEAKRSLRQEESSLFAWLLSTLLAGSIAFGAIAAREIGAKVSDLVVLIISTVLLVAAIVFNFRLAALRLVYADPALLQKIMRGGLGEDERHRIAVNAAKETQVDGTKI